MSEKNKNERFGVAVELPDPFLQKDLEAYQIAYHNQSRKHDPIPEAVIRSCIVKAGILNGWVKGLAIEDVEGTRASVIGWVANEIAKLVNEGQKIPPN